MSRNLPHYSIAFILFVCLCVAGIFAGYRSGFTKGYASGVAKRQSEEPFPKVYEVGDLMRSRAVDSEVTSGELDWDSVVNATQTTVFPSEWESLGGRCTMVPVPWLESLAINATSGVHERLEVFFSDLSLVKPAVAQALKEEQQRRQSRSEMMDNLLAPARQHFGEQLTPIDDISLVGAWGVQRHLADGQAKAIRYTFVDENTVNIGSSASGQPPADLAYFAYPETLVISGTSYVAAWTSK